ncbi:hypothetical protein [Pelagerythrobacter aerophilus]|uniref:Integron n=1 Tax=Pelagerythrobacter aerophilus TaxID=2306995 RepID=A0A418NJ67_9SPHN|nr:hypothetical protein [Pelagerythrobacter aerophilus]RIV79371.1 hypothetical protein D2V04_05115 [Pelagerythrobacter aerophilus]
MGLLPAILLTAQVIGPPAPPTAPAGEVRVPMIGLEGPGADACGGIARIATYDEEEPVRERPDPEAPESEKLPHKTLVWLCEASGEWQGIVYPSGKFQELGDCRVSSPVPEKRLYDGPCRHGWVIAENLELVVG